jgi:3-hydroxyacyl-CoA dehydrogenase / enoyl-CoA hydratase / 3-hydroxybutyryl-CoA epimerase
MPDFRQLQFTRDANNIVTVTFDVPDSPMNVFNNAVVRELVEVLSLLEREPARAVVFHSAKPSGFFAGADVHHIRELATPDEATAVQSVGQELFARVERLPFPTVAAIHGVCLGGGLEFALACKHRVARDDPQTKLGLPEVQLGLLPGWGGTVRLPKLVGLREALGMILEGKTVSAAKSAKIGLVDRAIPAETFEQELAAFVEDRVAGRSVRRPVRGLGGMFLDGTRPGRAIVFSTARKLAAKKGRDYPALEAALRAVQAGLKGGDVAGLAAERVEFPKLLFGSVARNLIDLFLNREKARKPATWVSESHAPRKVKKAAVVGAGIMGAGIAQVLALNKITVVLKDVNAEVTAAGLKRVEELTHDAAKKGALSRDEAGAALALVTATPEPEALAGADVVIEAVVEREEVKQAVFHDLATRLGPQAIFASNTSALSVSRIAEAVKYPGRVAGLHFFNPVHRMPLVEVVRGRATDDDTVATLVELARKLGKVPVVVADSPGFLVNRILFPYMDEAVRLVLEGVPSEVVDREAAQFGMPMGPLELLDQVGVDIAAEVAKTFAVLTTDTGPSPARFAEMVKDGAIGKKAGRGFYEYREGKRGRPTRWAKADGSQRARHHEAGELSAIQKRLMYPMINEAAKCLEAGIVAEAWMVDLAMVLGTGFAPFRGGPLRTADTLGLPRVVREMEALRSTAGERFAPTAMLQALAAEGRVFYAKASRAPASVS